MAYIVPRVLINQEFSQIPVFSEQPLSALIIGPQYKLFRYAEASEKPFTVVDNDDGNENEYQYDADTTYDVPNRPAGAIVDSSFTKVYLEKAHAKYFPNADLGTASATVVRVAVPNSSPTKYYNNRLTAAINVKDKTGFARDAVFASRDVKVGDYVEITNGTDTTVRSKVKALHATPVAAAVGTETNDTGNKPTQVEDFNDAPVWAGSGSTPVGSRVTVSNTSANYLGYVDLGVVEDTYTLEVTTGGNLSAVLWKITSANSVFAEKTDVALASAILVIDDEGANDIQLDFTSSTSFVAGDKFTVTVRAEVTQVETVAIGTYTGSKDLTYRLTVVRGGPLYDGSNSSTCARLSVTSDDTDSSATVNVAAATSFQVGSYGLTASFASAPTSEGFILGDVYLVPVTAAGAGAINIIETIDVLPAAFQAGTGSWTMSLFLVQDFEVVEYRTLDGSEVNWSVDVDAATITVNAGITTTDSTLHILGDAVDLVVDQGDLFVEHRDLLVDNTTTIASLNDPATVATVLGTVHPDNALAQGVYNAALNANGVTVYYIGVASDDLEGYAAALELAKKKNSYYGIVPLTFDTTVIDLIVSHVNTMSTAAEAKWRVAWIARQLQTEATILDVNDDDENFMAVVGDDPNVSGTKYDLVTIAGATLITDGVRATDKVRLNFRLDDKGRVVYDEYTVDSVETETTLKLTTGLTTAITGSGVKVEIVRPYTKDEQIDTYKFQAGEYNNRRVRAVFPDTVKNGGVEQNGYHVAAALAGLRSGVVPHQGLTNSEVLGFDDLTKTVSTFTEDQLNRLAEEGVWILSQEVVGATAYVRHQLTTDEESLNTSEDSPTSNVDSISYGLQKVLEPYIGKYNRNPYTLDLIRNAVFNELLFRQTGTFTETAGNQLNGFTIKKIEVNVAFKDRIDIEIQLDVPYPYNYINVTLFV